MPLIRVTEHYMEQHRGIETITTPFSGKVLVAGAGFIVTGAAWMMFGFMQHELLGGNFAPFYFVLCLLHVLTGVLVFKRLRPVVPIASVVLITGVVFASVLSEFLLVFTGVVVAGLTLFARDDIHLDDPA